MGGSEFRVGQWCLWVFVLRRLVNSFIYFGRIFGDVCGQGVNGWLRGLFILLLGLGWFGDVIGVE